MGWLADLLGFKAAIDSGGVEHPQRRAIKFGSGFTVSDDPDSGATLIEGGGGGGLDVSGTPAVTKVVGWNGAVPTWTTLAADGTTIQNSAGALSVKALGVTNAHIAASAAIAASKLGQSGATAAGQALLWNGTEWVPGTVSAGIAPVDHVQLQAPFYYTFTYNAGTKTLTADTGGTVPAIIFGVVPSIGQSVEMRVGFPLDAPDTRNGVYVITAISPLTCVRRADFDSTADLAKGASYPVLSGPYAGSVRTMTTSAPVLDTTPIALGPASSKSTLLVDLGRSYGVKDFPIGSSDWFYNGNISFANADKINQALWDFRSTPAVLQLPAGNGGQIIIEKPIDIWGGGTYLQGAGRTASVLIPGGIGGSSFQGGHVVCAYLCGKYPATGGTLVDQTVGSVPLNLGKAFDGSPDQYFLNLMYAGMQPLLENAAQFEAKIMFRLDGLAAGSTRHLLSCRGRRNGNDPTDVCFAIYYSSTGMMDAFIRARDTTAGVYGSIVQAGGGTSVMTGDGTIKPTEDATVVIKVEVGGTRGTADSKALKYSLNGGRTWSDEILLGAATFLTITDVNDYEQNFTAKFNFAAGTFVAGATYTLTCSGVNQQIHLSHPTTLAINTNYCATLQLVGGQAIFNVGVADGSTPSVQVSAAATGGILPYYWETAVVGTGANIDIACSNGDLSWIDGVLGSVRFKTSSVTATTTAAAAIILTAHPTGQVFFWRPNSTDLMNDRGGNLRRWIGYLTNVSQLAYLDPIRLASATSYLPAFGGVKDLGVDMGTTHCSGVWINSWNRHTLDSLRIVGGNTQLNIASFAGADFGSMNRDIQITGGYGWPLSFFGGSFEMAGDWSIADGNGRRVSMVGSIAAINQSGGTLFVNTESFCQNGICLSNCTGWFDQFYCDTENQGSQKHGGFFYMTAGGNGSFRIRGLVDLIGPYTPVVNAGRAADGPIHLDFYGAIGPAHHCYVDTKYSDAPLSFMAETMPIIASLPVSSRAGKVLRRGSRQPATVLTGTTNTLTWTQHGSFKRAAGNLAANATTTLSPTGMHEGDTYTITSGAQGFTEEFIDGAPGGVSLLTTAAGFVGTLTFRLNFSGNLEWV